MAKIENGGPAFPVEMEFYPGHEPRGIQTGSNTGWEQGMSLRDYFAAKALPDFIRYEGDRLPFRDVAQACYEMADAMLAARKAGE